MDKAFKQGDRVRIASDAPEKYSPGQSGMVGGSWRVLGVQIAEQYGVEKNTPIFTVQLDEDNGSVEVPATYLSPAS
jgi:hypothetical protein